MTSRGTRSPSAGEPSVGPPIHVVATAGHVDHGKSTLIRALTGIEPDRLDEERRRGLTIELGYAWRTLPSGREVGFVDVPGHERFVRTMLSGVGPVRLVLFVVSADEGWKPQSEEHLAIVDVLGVDGAVLALTKIDTVDAARADAAEAEVRSHIAGTTLERARLVRVSASTGDGLGGLVDALEAMLARAAPAVDRGRPRLFVDRVFTIPGAGTVVTGTLADGRLSIGDEVEIVPRRGRARVRGLETHKRPLEVAYPVSRVAVNLAGLGRGDVWRGDVLAAPRSYTETSVLEARVIPIRGLAHPLGSRGAFTFHAGAAERFATLRLLGDLEHVPPGGAFVRLRLSEPLALEVFDRFVLRESGRRETVAGGVVLDPSPPSRPGRDAGARLAARHRAAREELPALLVGERGAVPDVDVRRLADVTEIAGATRLGRWWIDVAVVDAIRGALVRRLASTSEGDPSALGLELTVARAEIARSLRSRRVTDDAGLVDAVLTELERAGLLVRDGARVALAGRSSAVPDRDLERLVSAVAAGEPTPPSIPELHAAGLPIHHLEAAIRDGALVRIAPDLVVTRGFVERAVGAIRAAGASGMTVSALRQALGTSRKYAVPLMEHLDRAGATRRDGDLRFARGV